MAYLQKKPRLLASAVLVALTMVASPVVVSAMHGADDSVSSPATSNSGSDTTTTETHGGRQQSVQTTNHGENGATEVNEVNDDNGTDTAASSDSLHDRAEQLLSQRRQNGKQTTEAARQQACDNRQTDIDNRLSNLGGNADKFLARFNDVFTKVQAYQTKHQLSVSNYDTLVADATAKQTAAASAVDTLKSLAGTKIDCTVSDPASSLAAVQTAANDAKTALQAYRSSLKSLVDAMLQASQSSNANAGSNQ